MHKNNKNSNIKRNKSNFAKKSITVRSTNTKKKVRFKCDYDETESLSKSLKGNIFDSSSSPDVITSKLTKQEDKITTINDIYSQGESLVRKKIKSSVKKEKILKLCKTQKEMIKSFEKKIKEKSFNSHKTSNNNICENNENEELKKISELNDIIYNKILEYLDIGIIKEIEGKNKENKIKEYTIEKTINFNIKSSYSNLNNLTKGKIIINNNYKIDIKNLIQNYIKEKNKSPKNSLDYLVKNYNNDYLDKSQNQFTFQISSPKKRKKVKFKNHSSKNLKAIVQGEGTPTQIISHQIKKTITKKIETYKNYKNVDLDDKLSYMKLNIGKTGTNSLSNYNTNKKSNVEAKSNNENIFTKFINSIYVKLKGK